MIHKTSLNLHKNYCSHWTKKWALKELITNAMESGSFTIENGIIRSERNGCNLTNLLVIGSGNKADHFGEGVKIAALIFTRLNLNLLIFIDQYIITYFFEDDVLTAHIEEVPNQAIDGVKIVLDATKEEMDQLYTTKPFGLWEGNDGVFVNNILFSKETKGLSWNIPREYQGREKQQLNGIEIIEGMRQVIVNLSSKEEITTYLKHQRRIAVNYIPITEHKELWIETLNEFNPNWNTEPFDKENYVYTPHNVKKSLFQGQQIIEFDIEKPITTMEGVLVPKGWKYKEDLEKFIDCLNHYDPLQTAIDMIKKFKKMGGCL